MAPKKEQSPDQEQMFMPPEAIGAPVVASEAEVNKMVENMAEANKTRAPRARQSDADREARADAVENAGFGRREAHHVAAFDRKVHNEIVAREANPPRPPRTPQERRMADAQSDETWNLR